MGLRECQTDKLVCILYCEGGELNAAVSDLVPVEHSTVGRLVHVLGDPQARAVILTLPSEVLRVMKPSELTGGILAMEVSSLQNSVHAVPEVAWLSAFVSLGVVRSGESAGGCKRSAQRELKWVWRC